MKLKSLLLGSVAAAGVTGGAYAADLGVVLPAASICSIYGISGLTIDGDANCLQITGSVTYTAGVMNAGAGVAYTSSVETELGFTATGDSSFGRTVAAIVLAYDESATHTITTAGGITGTFTSNGVSVSEAYVAIGDATQIIAGKTGSIWDTGSWDVDPSVTNTGGHVIQLLADLGNGLDVGIGLEALEDTTGGSIVGRIGYSGNGLTASLNAALGFDGDYDVHAGLVYSYDMVTFGLAATYDSTTAYDFRGYVELAVDMFTLKLSALTSSTLAWEVGVDATAALDGVTLGLGATYDSAAQLTAYAEVGFDITESLSAGALIEYDSAAAATFSFEGSLDWAVSDDTSAGLTATVDSAANWSLEAELSKSF